ncbi:tRNA(Ile)(2)-agmatinylcytidine synthase [Methanocaldococcus sp.]|uniref:tRNA(Ile)(2)-agmatinylcytidine synthase n=1 Tax=Methanocaldococcus sp. TaxID=2152917 RepID=UPI0026307EC7|nr:tRNA(Ile)(2)-agmatinylcytidine synthase [Methanocaldococcus sp.]MCQ6254159.1 tRNA(Ile)(2)-agmatinylcytidine synthase [Methanocaldococcus sp.]
MYIGIDDTDSPFKYCTTYIGTLLIEELKNNGYFVDMPKLIRMNPMVKYKTRGNGGVAIHVLNKDLSLNDIDEIKNITIRIVEKYTDFECENTNPGIVFLDENKYKENRGKLKEYYKEVLYKIVSIDYAEKFILKIGGDYIKYKLGRGIVGALGAISATPPFTYELLAYRKKEMWGKKRVINENSVIKMDKETFPYTFDNYDYENNKILITPNTPCPVLFGIRGINPEILLKAMNMIEGEKPERFMIFKTNQGTDVHLRPMKIKDIYPNTGVIVYGRVVENPKDIEGGHVIFRIFDNTGKIDCVSYEPTKKFRDVIRKLIVGDYIAVYGTVREKPLGINIEKIKILKLEKKYIKDKKCPYCGGTLKAKGKKTGYKCKKCKKLIGYDEIRKIEVERDLKIGFYEVPGSARRHLSKPIQLIDLI